MYKRSGHVPQGTCELKRQCGEEILEKNGKSKLCSESTEALEEMLSGEQREG